MELRHLRYFIAVAEELNYRRAAERLHISQPPLSKQIMALEKDLNSQLFIRKGRGISLTPSGRAFLKRSYFILNQVELGRIEVTGIETGNTGRLNIGFVDDIQFGPLSSLIADFQKKFPTILLYSSLDLSPNLASKVLSGELDVAIVELPLPLEAQNLAQFQLAPIGFVAVLSNDHPLASRQSIDLKELENEKFALCIDIPATSFRAKTDKLFEESGFKPQISQISDASIMYSKIAAKAGHVAITSEYSIPPVSPSYTCVPIRSASSLIEVSMIWNEKDASIITQNFINYIKENGLK